MEGLRPNEDRAKSAIMLIWVVLGIEVVSLISGYFQYNLLTSISNGELVTAEEAESNDRREMLIGITYLMVYIISAVAFIKWFRRAYYNLGQKIGRLSETDGWVAGAWFVPILGLFKPYKLMKEMYSETRALLLSRNYSEGENLNIASVGWWWTLWIISNLFAQTSTRMALKAEEIDQIMNATIAGIVSNIISIPLALITVKVIKDYAGVESLLPEITDEFPQPLHTAREEY